MIKTDRIYCIEVLDFMKQDEEEVMEILEWLEQNHQQNELSISEFISFQNIAMLIRLISIFILLNICINKSYEDHSE